MYHYSKYIARHLVHSTLLITFSLTSIVWLTQALRFIDFIVNQGVSIMVFLKLTLLLIPALVLMVLPPALFCAVLFVYTRLKSDSELVVMQAAGLSRIRLAWPAVQVAMGVTLVAYIIASYIQPVCYTHFRDMQLFLRNNYVSLLLQEGVFNSPVDGLTVFIRERDKDGILHGILVHDSRDHDMAVTMMADEGKLVETSQGPRFLLKDGNRQEMRGGKLSFLNFESYTLDIAIYTKAMKARTIDTQEMSLAELLAYDSTQTPENNLKRIAEGHQRIIWPLYPLTLTLVGMAVLLSGQFNRRGHWQRVAIASACGAFILFASVGLRGMMAVHEALIPAAYLNVLLPAAVACWYLVDHERRQRAVAATS